MPLIRREGSVRPHESRRAARRPDATSAPPSTAATSFGRSSGGFWRSPSIVTTIDPRARASPACIAGCWPKLRLRRTPRIRASSSCSRSTTAKDPSVEPSSTKISSKSRPASAAVARCASSSTDPASLKTVTTTDRSGCCEDSSTGTRRAMLRRTLPPKRVPERLRDPVEVAIREPRVERQRQRPLEAPVGAGERALVAVDREPVERVGADLALDPLRAQLRHHLVATLDLDHVGLPAVAVALVGGRQPDRQIREPLRVPRRDRLAGREQLLQPPHLRDPDRAEDVGEPVVERAPGHVVVAVGRAPAVVAVRAHALRHRRVVRRHRAALAGGDDLAWMEREAAGGAEPAAGAPRRRAPSAP